MFFPSKRFSICFSFEFEFKFLFVFILNRKTESVLFASNTPITTTGLVEFVLRHSQTTVRLQTSLQLCHKKCLINNLRLSYSHSRSVFRALNNGLRELSLVRQTIRKISGKKTKNKSQIKELKAHSNHLIVSIRKLRRNSVNISFLKTFIIERLKNFDKSSGRLNVQSINKFLNIFNQTSNHESSDKQIHKNVVKTKTLKKSTKYSKGEQISKRKDEL